MLQVGFTSPCWTFKSDPSSEWWWWMGNRIFGEQDYSVVHVWLPYRTEWIRQNDTCDVVLERCAARCRLQSRRWPRSNMERDSHTHTKDWPLKWPQSQREVTRNSEEDGFEARGRTSRSEPTAGFLFTPSVHPCGCLSLSFSVCQQI